MYRGFGIFFGGGALRKRPEKHRKVGIGTEARLKAAPIGVQEGKEVPGEA